MRILTFVSSGYLDLLALWLDQSAPHMPVRPTVVCMDEAALAALAGEERVEAVAAPAEPADGADRGAFWIRRAGIMLERMTAEPGLFVHCDLDAFWLADLASALAQTPFDLAFSMDRGHPGDLGKLWGHTLCPGFFMSRGGPALRPIAERWETETRRYSDDQNAINYLARDLGVVWRPETVLGHPGSRGTLRLEGRDVEILAIPRELCRRDLPIGLPGGTMVAHPFFDRRFRTAFVDTLHRLQREHGTLAAAALLPPPERFARQTRDWAAWQARLGLPIEDLSPAEIHHQATLAIHFAEPATACALFEAAAARGLDPADLATESHVAYMMAGRRDEARRALAAAIGRVETSHLARRFARMARRLNAPLLELRAWRKLAGFALRRPETVGLRIGRALRRYGPRRG